MKLSVYSLKNIVFQGQASLLNCMTKSGEITILDNHQSLITVLTACTMKVLEKLPTGEKKEHFFLVKSGFLEVRSENEVRCIID